MPCLARRAHPERYIVVDIEADGPIPGPHSLLSIGAVACTPDGDPLGTWYANLETLPGAAPHPETQRFWDANPEAWALARAEPLLPPAEAMAQYHDWLRQVTGNFRHRPVLVAAPAGFDAMWIHWYEWRFLDDAPTRNTSLDLKSVAVGVQGGPWHPALQSHRAPRAPGRRPHHALDDALGHADTFRRLRQIAGNGPGLTGTPASDAEPPGGIAGAGTVARR